MRERDWGPAGIVIKMARDIKEKAEIAIAVEIPTPLESPGPGVRRPASYKTPLVLPKRQLDQNLSEHPRW